MPLRTFPGRSAKRSPLPFAKTLLPPPHSCPALVRRAAGRACLEHLQPRPGSWVWGPRLESWGLESGFQVWV